MDVPPASSVAVLTWASTCEHGETSGQAGGASGRDG